MKTRAKGRRTLNKAKEWLQSQGWTVGEVERGGKFVKEKDLFGIYDLLAIKYSGNVLFVQVKTNTPAARKPLQLFSKCYGIRGMCMTWYDKPGKPRGWLLQYYLSSGKINKIDLRK